MPLVDINGRLDGQGKAWRSFQLIPVLVSIRLVDGPELVGSPVVVYGVKTFIEFLEECTDADFFQTSVFRDALAGHERGECGGIFIEESVLSALLSRRTVWQPMACEKRFRGNLT